MEQDVWERKYHLALERMERDERDFRALEEGLRRLALRLGALARGQGDTLDRLLDRLSAELRHVPALAAIDPLLDALAEAVTQMDAPPPAPPAETDADALAGEYVRDDAGSGDVDELRADIARLQELLAVVSLRLGDMTRYLAVELEKAGTSDEGGRALDANVREEMRALGERTRAAVDLGSLQTEVNARLSLIDQHFREYREREEARLAEYRERAERMRNRVAELENQASSLQDSLQREHELALTDRLTGLPNRLAYERHIADVERSVHQGGEAACVGAFDIDRFKDINDTYGHAAGDAVLRIVGQTLARELDGRAFVARFGGEEFVVVFSGAMPDEALDIARGLCATVEKLAFHASSRPVTVTMSGGIADFGADDSAAAVFDRADRALYRAKRAGRNRCVLI